MLPFRVWVRALMEKGCALDAGEHATSASNLAIGLHQGSLPGGFPAHRQRTCTSWFQPDELRQTSTQQSLRLRFEPHLKGYGDHLLQTCLMMGMPMHQLPMQAMIRVVHCAGRSREVLHSHSIPR